MQPETQPPPKSIVSKRVPILQVVPPPTPSPPPSDPPPNSLPLINSRV